jgi:glucosamine-6-phosphate deaminase
VTARFTVDALDVRVFENLDDLAGTAAHHAAGAIARAVEANGVANVMFASGNSQLAFLDHLVARSDVEWGNVIAFHMDEYAGIPATHPASFQRYMRERIAARVGLREFHYIDGDAPDATAEADRYAAVLRDHPLALCCLGIGENGHLAFNDPPADFETEEPYLVVQLDERCRRQQVGEGWFATIDDVPKSAMSMSIKQILSARGIVCVVPERRKAEAVRASVQGPIDPMVPASILQRHSDVAIYLDRESASLLDRL